jgi:hypothetical protein
MVYFLSDTSIMTLRMVVTKNNLNVAGYYMSRFWHLFGETNNNYEKHQSC